MSQCNDIINHIQTKGTITPLEALSAYGCFRLAARILELKDRGYDIDRRTVKRNGKEYAEYFMATGEAA